MKIILFQLLLLLICISQTESKKVKAFTHVNETIVYLYAKPKGKIIKKLIKDEEAGWIAEVIRVEKNYCEVNFSDLGIRKVWILKNNLYINTRNYNGEKITLYSTPNKKSKIKSILVGEQTVRIIDIKFNWVFIEGKGISNKTVRGWLEPEMQCGNPYTTCP